MNPLHAHLIWGHAPVVALVLGVVLVELGVWRDDAALRRLGLLALAAAWAAGLAVYLTGRVGEALAVELGAPPALVARHERWGAASLAALSLTALGAAAALRREAGRRLLAAVTAAGVLCLLLLARTSWHGGRIRHPEIQPEVRP